MAPRGIVAAAVSALFAIELVRNGYPEARVLVPITFLVIIVTITVYGLSSMPLAKWLKLANPNPQGCIISGAYPLARSIGKVLHTLGYKVIMVDTNWNNIADARMEGLPAYYGSIISKTIQDEIDLDGIGKLLAITPNKEINSLAALYYSKIFGISEVYQFPIDDKRKHEKEKVSRDLHGQILFGEEFNYFEMIKKFRSGYVVKTTPITEEFTYEKFTEKYGSENIVPLFLVDEDEKLKIYTTEEKPEPEAGEIIVTLMKDNQVQNK
jgi:hypothetical protein